MAKGQKRSNKEIRKPKQDKKAKSVDLPVMGKRSPFKTVDTSRPKKK